MADTIRKMQSGHKTSDIDGVIDEVSEARGEYESLSARLAAIEARLAALEPQEGE